MANSACTITESKQGDFHKIVFDWLSDDSAGTVTATTSNKYNGLLVRAIFDPDAGDTQPSDAYDVVVNDADGYDLLNGLGANLSQSVNVYKTQVDGLTCVLSSTLTLSVSGAGNAKGGVVVLYIMPIS